MGKQSEKVGDLMIGSKQHGIARGSGESQIFHNSHDRTTLNLKFSMNVGVMVGSIWEGLVNLT